MLLVLGFTAKPLLGEQLTLEPSKDNTLYAHSTGGLSNGRGDEIFAGINGATGGNRILRGLIAFDLTSIPPGSTIESVTLTMRQSNTSNNLATSRTVSLYRILKDWGEGTSLAGQGGAGGAPSTSGDATWIHTFFNTQQWDTPGGDFSGTESASVSVGGNGPYTWGSTAQMVADVQNWVNDPTSNFGWIVRGAEGGSSATAKRFDSSEEPTVGNRPKLTVTYTPAAQEELSDRFFFPLHGDGGGLSTSYVLLNIGRDARISMKFFGRDAAPLSISLGELGDGSEFSFDLPRGAAFSASSAGGTGPLTVGYADVSIFRTPGGTPAQSDSEDESLDGTAIFSLGNNEAGVPVARKMKEFTLFLDSLGPRDTGLALVYPYDEADDSTEDSVLTIEVWDKNFVDRLGMIETSLSRGEAFGKFIYEIFADAGAPQAVVDTLREVEAIITVTASEDVAAVAMRQNGSALTTFPVTKGRAAITQALSNEP